jgi:hypothetical protein
VPDIVGGVKKNHSGHRPAFNRVVSMMAAEDIDASPIMITGEVMP